MLSVLERSSYQNKTVIAFKPKMDDRYASSHIVTHAGLKFKAYNVASGQEIIEMSENYDVIGVDEAFMIDGAADALLSLYRQGKTVVVSSIQLSASGQVFEEVGALLPWATKIEVCPAVCPITGKDAYYSYRKTADTEKIVVGGTETYEPRCFETHDVIRIKEEVK